MNEYFISLAIRIDELAYQLDTYAYMDDVDNREDLINNIVADLENGKVDDYINYLDCYLEEEVEDHAEIVDILAELCEIKEKYE